MIAAILVKLAWLLGCSIAGEAHQINLTNARIIISPDRIVEVEIALKGSDADRVAGTRVFDDATGFVRPAALTAASAIIVAYVKGHTTVLGEDGVSCRPGAAGVASDGDGVVVRVPWFCVGVADPLRYRSTVWTDVSPDARQVVLIGTGADAAQDLLDAGRTETALTAASTPRLVQVIGRYLEAGIAHIFLGYDHIAFLAAVVLWARRLWPVVKVVTAFTVAHSITLSLAALDIVQIRAPSSSRRSPLPLFMWRPRTSSLPCREAVARCLRLRPDPRLRLRQRFAGVRPVPQRAGPGACFVQYRRGNRTDRDRLPCRPCFAWDGSPAGIGPRSCGAADPPGACGLCHLGSDHRLRQLLGSRSHRAYSVTGGGRYAAAPVIHRIRHSTFASPNQTVLA